MRWNHDSPRSTSFAIGRAAGGGRDALGPARGVFVFLFGEPEEDVSPLGIGLALGEQR